MNPQLPASKFLVLGVGNPLRGDDVAGLYTLEVLKEKLEYIPSGVDIRATNASGINLIDELIGYDVAIIVDTVPVQEKKVGKVTTLKPEDFSHCSHMVTSHLNTATVLEFGRKTFPQMVPRKIVICAIGIKEVRKFGEGVSKRVREAAEKAAEVVLKELEGVRSQ